MRCKYNINGYNLTEDQLLDYLEKAERELTSYSQRFSLQPVTREQVIADLREKGLLNKRNKYGLRVPMGHRKWGINNTPYAIQGIMEYNRMLKNRYGIEENLIRISGNNATIDGMVLRDIERVAAKSGEITEEQIYEHASILIEADQAMESLDPLEKTNYNDYIEYKKSLIRRLEKQLAIIDTELANTPSYDPKYDKQLALKKEIELRLNGSQDLNERNKNYNVGLRGEIKFIEKANSAVEIARFIASDKRRLEDIMKRDDMDSIAEAEKILNFFTAFINRFIPEHEEHIILSRAELQNPEIIKYIDSIHNEIKQWRTELTDKKHTKLLEILNKNEEVKKLFGSKLNYEAMFKEHIDDLSFWDYFTSDGVHFAFTEAHPILQVMKMLLEQTIDEYKSKAIQWEEKLLGIQPKLEKELRKMGYGLNIFGIIRLGASYDMFRQKWSNGKSTERIVTRESAEYEDELRRTNDKFLADIEKAKDSQTPNKLYRDAFITRNIWKRKNQVIVDPRKIVSIMSDPDFAEYKEYFIDDGGEHEKELEKHLGSREAVEEFIESQRIMIKNYAADYRRLVDFHLRKAGVTDIKDLSPKAIREIKVFTARNNPFLGAAAFVKDITYKLHEGESAIFPNLTHYNLFVARRFKIDTTEGITVGKNAFGEVLYKETQEETGYYDKTYELIEKNPILKEFYNLMTEILDTCKNVYPPSVQKELWGRTLPQQQKVLLELLLDPKVEGLKRISPAYRYMVGKIKHLVTQKLPGETLRGIIDPVTGEGEQEVVSNTSTVSNDIKTLFVVESQKFLNTLPDRVREKFRQKDKENPSQRTGAKRLTRKAVISYDLLTHDSKILLAKWLECEPSDTEIKKVLGSYANQVPIGRILQRYCTSHVVHDQSFNLIKLLRLYSAHSMEYAARIAIQPYIDTMKDEYKKVQRAKKNSMGEFIYRGIVGGRHNKDIKEAKEWEEIKLQRKLTKEEEKQIEQKFRKKINAGERHLAAMHVEKLYNKAFINDLPNDTFGVKKEKILTVWKADWLRRSRLLKKDITLSSLTHDEKLLHNEIQKLIEEERNQENPNEDNINELIAIQNHIGENFAASALAERILDTTRLIGLAINVVAGIGNIIQGRMSNYTKAASGRLKYITEDSYWRAESVVMKGSTLKLWSGGLASRIPTRVTKNAKKLAILMRRYKVFQDSSNEIYKASQNSAIKLATSVSEYWIMQRTEYLNQAPILGCMLMEYQIEGIDESGNKVTSNVFDAMDENGNLLPAFNTEQNRKTWVETSSKEFATFKTIVDNNIKDTAGDYTEFGSSVHSHKIWYKAMMMFKRWLPRYVSYNYGVEQSDAEQGIRTKGIKRSHNKATATVAATIVGGAVMGPLMVPVAGIMIPMIIPFGLAIGVAFGRIMGMKSSRNNTIAEEYDARIREEVDQALSDTAQELMQVSDQHEINMLKEILINMSHIAITSGLLMPKAMYAMFSGRSLVKDAKLGWIQKYLDNTHRVRKIDIQGMKANNAEMAVILNLLVAKAIAMAILSGKDDDDEKKWLNLIINLLKRSIDDVTMLMNPKALWDRNLGEPTVERTFSNGLELVKAWGKKGTPEDIITTGPKAGESRFKNKMHKLLPSAIRPVYGFEGLMEKVNFPNDFDKIFLYGTDKEIEQFVTPMRTEYRGMRLTEMLSEITPEMYESMKQAVKEDAEARGEELSEGKLERRTKRLIIDEIKSMADSEVDDVIPTYNALKKAYEEMGLAPPSADEIMDFYEEENKKLDEKLMNLKNVEVIPELK